MDAQHRTSTSDGDVEVADSGYCPVFQRTMELLGRRWTGVILRCLLDGEQRFSELRRAIPGLSDRLLAERLDELSDAHLVARCTSSRGEAKEFAAYRLTPTGEHLRPVLDEIARFAARCADEAPS